MAMKSVYESREFNNTKEQIIMKFQSYMTTALIVYCIPNAHENRARVARPFLPLAISCHGYIPFELKRSHRHKQSLVASYTTIEYTLGIHGYQIHGIIRVHVSLSLSVDTVAEEVTFFLKRRCRDP